MVINSNWKTPPMALCIIRSDNRICRSLPSEERVKRFLLMSMVLIVMISTILVYNRTNIHFWFFLNIRTSGKPSVYGGFSICWGSNHTFLIVIWCFWMGFWRVTSEGNNGISDSSKADGLYKLWKKLVCEIMLIRLAISTFFRIFASSHVSFCRSWVTQKCNY